MTMRMIRTNGVVGPQEQDLFPRRDVTIDELQPSTGTRSDVPDPTGFHS